MSSLSLVFLRRLPIPLLYLRLANHLLRRDSIVLLFPDLFAEFRHSFQHLCAVGSVFFFDKLWEDFSYGDVECVWVEVLKCFEADSC